MAATAIAGQQMEMMAGRRTQSRAVSLAERNRELYEAQRRARRGPTPEVFFTKHIDNSRIVKADDPERRREMREENRQLRLSEAQLTDPERIDKIAKQLGLDAPQPGQVVRPDGSDVNAP